MLNPHGACSASRSPAAARRSRRRRGGRSSPRARRDELHAALGPAAEVAAHDAKLLRLGRAPADDTLIAAYLVDPGRSGYVLDDLARRVRARARPRAGDRGGDRAARPPRRGDAASRADRCASGCASGASSGSTTRSSFRSRPCSATMEDAGIRIDTYRMGEITARLADRVEELEARGDRRSPGEEFLLGSTQQLARILFEKLGLTPGRKGKTGYSTDARVLRDIRDEHAIVPVIEEWRELTKLLNTYLLPLPTLIDEHDGRLHTTFNQAVAATGRLSTTNPNLQSIPVRTELGAQIRSAFIADGGHAPPLRRLQPGRAADPRARLRRARPARGVRARRGHPCRDRRRGARHPAGGAHARRAGHREDGQLRDHLRDLVVRALGEPRDPDATRRRSYIDTYLARFPRVQEFIARTIAQAAADGYVTTLLGRRRPIPELRASNRQTRSLGERLAVNTVMQGTAADVIKVAMVRIHDRLRREGRASRLVLQVHDELLLEVPEVETSAVRELVREEMVGAYPLDPPLAVEVGRRRHLGRREGLTTSALRIRNRGSTAFDGSRTVVRESTEGEK